MTQFDLLFRAEYLSPGKPFNFDMAIALRYSNNNSKFNKTLSVAVLGMHCKGGKLLDGWMNGWRRIS